MLAAFVYVALALAITFFLEGQVQTFGYIIISMAFGAFAVITSSNDEGKTKNNG